MKNSRSYDFLDMLVGTQQNADGPAPTKSPHYIGCTIGESNFQTGAASILTTIKANPYICYASHISIGVSNTPVDLSQTGLIEQYSIWPIDVFTANVLQQGNQATHLYQCYFPMRGTLSDPSNDDLINIQEVGLWGNYGATLLCRQLLSFDNRPIISGNKVNPVDLMIHFILNFTWT